MPDKAIRLLFFGISIVVSMVMNTSMADDSSSPSDVVREFLRLDSEGARLSWRSSYLIDHLVDPQVSENRPGWDTFDVVAKHSVVEEEIDDNTATVKVQFDRKGIAAINQLKTQEEEYIFEFGLRKKGDDGWVITKEPPNPNVSIDYAIEKFKSLYDKQNESTKKKMDDIIAQLEKWRESCKGRS